MSFQSVDSPIIQCGLKPIYFVIFCSFFFIPFSSQLFRPLGISLGLKPVRTLRVTKNNILEKAVQTRLLDKNGVGVQDFCAALLRDCIFFVTGIIPSNPAFADFGSCKAS